MGIMLNVVICGFGMLFILALAELLYRRKILHGEYLRKFVHIISACFIAFWPWLISWHWIELINLGGLIIVITNHSLHRLHSGGDIKRSTYGGMLFPIAVMLCALLTHEKIFFTLAVLHLGLADGLAAIAGTSFRRVFRYAIFGNTKSVIGSMTFWLVSMLILGIGLLFTNNLITYHDYLYAIFILPPALMLLENVSINGTDNLTVPLVVIAALRLLA